MKSGASRKPPLLPSRPETKPTAATTARIFGPSASRPTAVATAWRVVRMRSAREHQDVGGEHERAARDPAGEHGADDGQGQAEQQADAHDAPVDVPGPGVAPAREPGRRDRRGQRRRDRDHRRDAERVQERGGDGGAALAERAGQEADAGADQQRSEEELQVHDLIERQAGPLIKPLRTTGIIGYPYTVPDRSENRHGTAPVEYVLAVIDHGSFTAGRGRGRRGPAVALRGRPPARDRARRPAVRPGRAHGRGAPTRAGRSKARPGG